MKNKLIQLLLDKSVIGTNFNNPITFKSGTKSPIYCDFRKTRDSPDLLDLIIEALKEKYSDQGGFDVIMSVYSGAAHYGEILARELKISSAYVRPDAKAKGYGLKKMIEGASVEGKKVLLIEDLISTGGSILENAEKIREAGATEVHCISIFSYEVLGAQENFKTKGFDYSSLLTVHDLLPTLKETLPEDDYEGLLDWVDDPTGWFDRHALEFDFGYLTQLRKTAAETRSLISFGLDPVIEALPEEFQSNGIFGFVRFMSRVFIELTDQKISPAAFKPNLAWWEDHNKPMQNDYSGSKALVEMLGLIGTYFPDIPVILDYKNGDIGTSSGKWASSGFDKWQADAVTVHPYMGSDSVGPFIKYCNGMDEKGVYVLVKTSNPGSADFELQTMTDGRAMYEQVAQKVIEWSKNRPGVGVVIAGNSPEELRVLGETFAGKDIPALIPGVGKSQGGDAGQVAQILRESGFELALARINLSSGLTRPWYKKGEPNPSTDECVQLIVEQLRSLNEKVGYNK